MKQQLWLIAAVLTLTTCATAVSADEQGAPPRKAALVRASAIDPEVERLIKSLSSTDRVEQQEAIRRLGEMREAATPAVPHLIKLLNGRDVKKLGEQGLTWEPEAQASTALHKLGEIAFMELERAYPDASGPLRLNIVRTAVAIHKQYTVPFLLRAIKDATAPVRAAAYEGLTQSSVAGLMPIYIAGLRDPEPSVRNVIATWIAEISSSYPSALRSYPEKERRLLTPALIPLLAEPTTRVAALNALGKTGTREAVEAVAPFADRPESDVRYAAIRALTDLKHVSGVPALIRALKFEEPVVGSAATYALGALRDPRATVPLTRLLQTPGSQLRWDAAYALGMLGDRHAVPALMDAMREAQKEALKKPLTRGRQNEPRELAIAAIEALGKLRDPRAVTPLLALLQADRPDNPLASSAAQALGHIADPVVVPALVRAFFAERSAGSGVAESIRDALRELKSVRTVPLLVEGVLRHPDGWRSMMVRGLIGELVGEGDTFIHDHAALVAWWNRHRSEYPSPQPDLRPRSPHPNPMTGKPPDRERP